MMQPDAGRSRPLEGLLPERQVLTPGTEAHRSAPWLELFAESFLAVINLRGFAFDPAFDEAVRAVLGFGVPIEPGTTVRVGDIAILWMGPDEWLVLGPDGAEGMLHAKLAEALAGQPSAVVDVSNAYTAMVLVGPGALELWAAVCGLDLAPDVFLAGHCATTQVLGLTCVVHRLDDGPVDRLLITRSHARGMAVRLAALAERVRHCASVPG